MTLALVFLIVGCTSQTADPAWVKAFGYTPPDIHSIGLGDFGFPYVPVRIGATRLILPFDTGNMVGVSVSPELFDQMGLTTEDSYDLLNSAGEIVASLRVASPIEVSVLRRHLGPTPVYELHHPSLRGIMGHAAIGGGHFTLDYRSRRMGLSTATLPDTVPGFRQVALVRSSRHPMLILVRGTIEDREVLLELDTGKSRTVINPTLASALALERRPQGVTINSLRIGDLSFEVLSAKEVDQTAIDPDLPQPILAGVGSDILSRFVWTVDYDAGVLWIPVSG